MVDEYPLTTTENQFEELVINIVQAGRCTSPDVGIKVLFNGGFENDSPYFKGDIGHDTGQTCLSGVAA